MALDIDVFEQRLLGTVLDITVVVGRILETFYLLATVFRTPCQIFTSSVSHERRYRNWQSKLNMLCFLIALVCRLTNIYIAVLFELSS